MYYVCICNLHHPVEVPELHKAMIVGESDMVQSDV